MLHSFHFIRAGKFAGWAMSPVQLQPQQGPAAPWCRMHLCCATGLRNLTCKVHKTKLLVQSFNSLSAGIYSSSPA